MLNRKKTCPLNIAHRYRTPQNHKRKFLPLKIFLSRHHPPTLLLHSSRHARDIPPLKEKTLLLKNPLSLFKKFSHRPPPSGCVVTH
jgi:hypothetical protein